MFLLSLIPSMNLPTIKVLHHCDRFPSVVKISGKQKLLVLCRGTGSAVQSNHVRGIEQMLLSTNKAKQSHYISQSEAEQGRLFLLRKNPVDVRNV